MSNLFVPLTGSVLPEMGAKLVVANRDEDKHTNAFFVVDKHIIARKQPGTMGTLHGIVPGGGGDLLWVEHEDGSIAAYCFNELAEVKGE
jgi:hypothetical protein